MTTTADFDAWLEDAEPSGHLQVYALYRAVSGVREHWLFECTVSPDGTQWFLTAKHVVDTLLLASEEERSAFLALLSARYADGEDIKTWFERMEYNAQPD